MISTVVMMLGLTIGAEQACPDYDKAPYDQAYHKSLKTGRPLLALIGAPWCIACPRAHQLVPRLHKLGEYGYINCDQDREFAQKVADYGPIPRLAIYRRVKDHWEKTVVVDANKIEDFIKEEEKKVAPTTAPKKAPTVAIPIPKPTVVTPAPAPKPTLAPEISETTIPPIPAPPKPQK